MLGIGLSHSVFCSSLLIYFYTTIHNANMEDQINLINNTHQVRLVIRDTFEDIGLWISTRTIFSIHSDYYYGISVHDNNNISGIKFRLTY